MKRNPLKAGILLCLLVALAEAAPAAIIANGGLETLPGDTFRTVSPGSTYAGWNSVGGGDIEFTTVQTAVPGGFWGPVAEGSGCVDLNGIAYQGAISQMLTNEPGAVYRLRFAMSGNPGILGQPRRATKTMDVSWGGHLRMWAHLHSRTCQATRRPTCAGSIMMSFWSPARGGTSFDSRAHPALTTTLGR